MTLIVEASVFALHGFGNVQVAIFALRALFTVGIRSMDLKASMASTLSTTLRALNELIVVSRTNISRIAARTSTPTDMLPNIGERLETDEAEASSTQVSADVCNEIKMLPAAVHDSEFQEKCELRSLPLV